MAASDLCRRGARRTGGPACDRGVQRDRPGPDGDRALLLGPARPHRRTLPRDAERHDRRRAVGRRLDGLADRGHGLRRLLPARAALLARRARALQPLRARRDLEGGIRQGRRTARLRRIVGSLPFLDEGTGNQACRPAGQARLHLPDRRPLPRAVRRRAGHAPLGGHRDRAPDG